MTLDQPLGIVDDTSRYDRLELGWGPDTQGLVGKSTTTVLTEGHLGKFVASYLISAGFGHVRLVGNESLQRGERFLWSIPLEEKLQVAAYADAFQILNPGVRVSPIRGALESSFIRDRIKKSSVIVDATNSPKSKAWTINAALTYGIPAISASCDMQGASFMCLDPRRDRKKFQGRDTRDRFMMWDYQDRPQDMLVSMATAGPIDEEVKRFILGQETISHESHYVAPNRPAKKAI